MNSLHVFPSFDWSPFQVKWVFEMLVYVARVKG
jgi:hypothetical protein